MADGDDQCDFDELQALLSDAEEDVEQNGDDLNPLSDESDDDIFAQLEAEAAAEKNGESDNNVPGQDVDEWDNKDEDEMSRMADEAEPIVDNAVAVDPNDLFGDVDDVSNDSIPPKNDSIPPKNDSIEDKSKAEILEQMRKMQEQMALLQQQIMNTSKSPTSTKSPSSSDKSPTFNKTVKKSSSSADRSFADAIFGDAGSASKRPKKSQLDKLLAKKSESVVHGDDDAEWGEEFSDKKQNLSESGESLNQLIKTGERSRKAHTPSYEPSAIKKKSPSNRGSSFYNKSSATASQASSRPSPMQSKSTEPQGPFPGQIQVTKPKPPEDEKDVVVDTFSQLRIRKPLISSTSMKQRMSGRKFIKMSHLYKYRNSAEIKEVDWVTIGVLVRKSEPKLSSKGSNYSIWKLSDLSDNDKIVSLFCFGQVHEELWKTPVGSVVGILNPNIMPAQERASDEMCISVEKPSKVMKMGESKDFGSCTARTKAGNKCTQFINMRLGEFCAYHVQAEYRKVSSHRTELQASQGVVPKTYNKAFQQKGAKGETYVMYEGRTYTSSISNKAAVKKRNQVNVKTLQKHAANQGGKKVNTMTLHEILPEDKAALKKLEADNKSMKQDLFLEALAKPSVGAMNLVKHLVKKEHDQNVGKVHKEQKLMSISSSELLKIARSGMQGNKDAAQSKAKQAAAPNLNLSGPPRIGRGLAPGQSVNLFDTPSPKAGDNRKVELAKKRAIAKLQEKGGMKKENPNAVASRNKTQEKQESIKKRVAESMEDSSSERENKEEAPPKKKSRFIGGLDMDDPNVQKVVKARSKHQSELSDMEAERLEKYFRPLEKKEMYEEKMASIKEMVCDVVICDKCDYTSFKVSAMCKDLNHVVRRTKAKKRFFKCTNCSNHTSSFLRYPKEACRCGSSKYMRASMLKEKKGPKLASEKLVLRGEESSYLNSLNSNADTMNL